MKNIRVFLVALKGKPLAILNSVFLLMIAGIFLYLVTTPINVLDNWTIKTVQQSENGELPVFNPNTSLIFNSESVKISSAKGDATRYLECRDNSGRTVSVQLDVVPVGRPAGNQPPQDNSIIVPDTTQFDGLPKMCRLVIDIFYSNVVLWRDHTEHAESNWFIVDEPSLTREEILKRIIELETQIEELKGMQLQSSPGPTDVIDPPVVVQLPPPEPPPVTETPEVEEQTLDCAISVLFVNLLCN